VVKEIHSSISITLLLLPLFFPQISGLSTLSPPMVFSPEVM